MVRHLAITLSVLGTLVFSGCASAVPPSRLTQYVGPADSSPLPPQRPVRAGLVVVSDTSDPQAAPALPDEAVNRLAEELKQQFSTYLPITVDKIIPAENISRPDPSQLRGLGKRYGVDYLMVAVLSSTEQEYPIYVFLGWATHMQPGWRRDNWSLAEVALVEAETGRTVLKAEGRGWATLDRPTAPGINQWYPVIWLRPQDPNRRYWPPTYAGAPNSLRVIAMQEAVKRLVINLQDAWIHQRAVELEQGRG
jgi:hypothetical protein